MRHDKKVSGGEIKFVLAGGSARSSRLQVPAELIEPALNLRPQPSTSMAAVSETIVREYFELHEFLVRQHRKYIAQTKREDDDIDFFVLNPHPQKREAQLPFVLSSPDLKSSGAPSWW